jgi:hypothetical protein
MSVAAQAQLSTSINGVPVSLKQATKGPLELHYTLFQRQYYFYIRQGEQALIPLTKEEQTPNYYKTKLSELTGGFGDTGTLEFALKPLKAYLNAYHRQLDPEYVAYEEPAKLAWWGMLFAGATNNPFVTNKNNQMNPMLGLEIEVAGNVTVPKHSGFFQYRYAFPSDNFDYQTQEFALGYRYRFLRKNWGALFGQLKAATFNNSETTLRNEDDQLVTLSSNSFDAAFIFGLGVDLKLGANSYLTFIYGELFAVFLNNQGNFPLDFSLGYKLRF